MEMKLKFNNVCQACGRTRRKHELAYDLDELKAYCARMEDCSDAHPNSYPSVIERSGVTVTMVPYERAADLYYDRMLTKATPLMKKAIKLLDTPTSIRVDDEHIARYLIKMQELKNYKSMSKTINAIIKEHREQHGDLPEPEPEPTDEKLVKEKPVIIESRPAPSKSSSPEPPNIAAPVFTPKKTEPAEDDFTF